MADVVTVLAKIRAAKGKGDALAAFLKDQSATFLGEEPGCVVYRIHRSTTTPELFMLYEVYRDAAAFDVHRASPHLAAFRQRREEQGLVEGPAEVEVYRPITD